MDGGRHRGPGVRPVPKGAEGDRAGAGRRFRTGRAILSRGHESGEPAAALGVGRLSRRSTAAVAYLLGVASLTGGCGGSDAIAPPAGPASIEVEPSAVLMTELGELQQLTISVTDGGGAGLPLSVLEWTVLDPTVASAQPVGRRIRAEGAGTTALVLSAGAIADTVSIEVYLDQNQGPFIPGSTYFGREDYVEYQPGTLPLILASPHGGYLEPEEIPDRTFGVILQDRRTQEVTRALADAVEARTGRRPHMIISRLHRIRLDPNREIVEAAQGSPFAEQAWAEFHGFIEAASATVESDLGPGLFLDLHGHAHDIDRVELGYRLTAADLETADNALAAEGRLEKSSVRRLAGAVGVSFAELIRGGSSLGGLLQDGGYRTVPSPDDPDPGGNPYFTGGYDVDVHGSSDGGLIDGVQIEMQWPGLRETEATRAAFVAVLVDALEEYLLNHFGYDWTAGA